MEHRPFQSITLEAAPPLADVQRNAFAAFHAQIWKQEYSETRPARRLTPLEWACLWDAIRAHGLSVYPMTLPGSGTRLAIVHRPDEAPDRDPVILLDSRHAPKRRAGRKMSASLHRAGLPASSPIWTTTPPPHPEPSAKCQTRPSMAGFFYAHFAIYASTSNLPLAPFAFMYRILPKTGRSNHARSCTPPMDQAMPA